jgi:hypothetical protein
MNYEYTVKKRLVFFPSAAGDGKPSSPWSGIIKLFPARESSFSDIPAGVAKTITFFTVYIYVYSLYCTVQSCGTSTPLGS